jgi:hypothetical protein
MLPLLVSERLLLRLLSESGPKDLEDDLGTIQDTQSLVAFAELSLGRRQQSLPGGAGHQHSLAGGTAPETLT